MIALALLAGYCHLGFDRAHAQAESPAGELTPVQRELNALCFRQDQNLYVFGLRSMNTHELALEAYLRGKLREGKYKDAGDFASILRYIRQLRHYTAALAKADPQFKRFINMDTCYCGEKPLADGYCMSCTPGGEPKRSHRT